MGRLKKYGTSGELKIGIFPVLSVGILVASLVSTQAAAQQNDALIPIEDRSRPEYESRPIFVGAFEIFPSISADVEYVDNLFASDIVKVNDTILSITPAVTIRDRREDRALALKLSAGYETYLENQVDDRLLLSARGSGRLGLGTATRPFAGFNVSRNNTRGRNGFSFSDTAQPLKLINYGGNVGVEQDVSDFTVTGEARYDATDYNGSLVIDGVDFSSGLRNYKSYSGRGRVAYSRDPSQSFYLETTYNKRDYSDNSGITGLPANLAADRSSDGFILKAGFARRLTEVLQLDVNLGYLQQKYKDPAYDTVNSFSFDGNLFWSPTRLTTVQARASRNIDETSDPLFNGLLRTQFSLGVQHELQRNLIVSGEAQYAVIDIGNLDQNGSEFGFTGSARYLISPKWSVRLRAEMFDRDVIFPGSQKRVSLGVQYNF